MLRITFEEQPSGPTIKLEGRLVGPWVAEFQQFWRSTRNSEDGAKILVDLKKVTSIDKSGKALLQQVHQQGGIFVASGCLIKAIVEDVTAGSI